MIPMTGWIDFLLTAGGALVIYWHLHTLTSSVKRIADLMEKPRA